MKMFNNSNYRHIVLWFLLLFVNVNFALAASNHQFASHISSIPDPVRQQMMHYSWRSNCPVTFDDLAYVSVSYHDFNDATQQGILIVNRRVANEVVAIFHELYSQHFPIYQIKPVDAFQGQDDASLNANNTAAFNCRPTTGSNKLYSYHAYGLAIDINPVQNPYVKGQIILPRSGERYIDRNSIKPGMISRDDPTYRDFQKQGWSWGGKWRSRQDYQHFQKAMTRSEKARSKIPA